MPVSHFSSLLLPPPGLAVPELHGLGLTLGCGPLHTVFDDPQHILIVIGRERLVAGAEVEDASRAAGPAAAGAEDFAAAEAGDEHGLLGLGDVEELAVHFLAPNDEVIVDALHAGVAGPRDPEDLV